VKISALMPQAGSSFPFEFRHLRGMPDAPGCYALAIARNDILYIGQATSLQRRLIQHWDAGRHKLATSYGRISKVSVIEIPDAGTLNAFERGWINQCELFDGAMPPLNKVGAPV
jgi:excinuclease UvrABC nuclease subunit